MIKTLILKPNKKILLFMSFALLFLLLAFYVFQINNFVSSGYILRNQQKSFEKLSQENEKLETSSAAAGSLGRAEEKISELGFEKISKIHYIQIMETAVAAK